MNFFQFLVIKTLDSELDPDPHIRKNVGSGIRIKINADPQPCDINNDRIHRRKGRREDGVRKSTSIKGRDLEHAVCAGHVPALAVPDDEAVEDVLVHLESLLLHLLQDPARALDVALLAMPATKNSTLYCATSVADPDPVPFLTPGSGIPGMGKNQEPDQV